MTTPPLGVYRISERGDIKGPHVLAVEENGNVTVLPLNAAPNLSKKGTTVHFTF